MKETGIKINHFTIYLYYLTYLPQKKRFSFSIIAKSKIQCFLKNQLI